MGVRLLLKLQDDLRSGNLSVKHGKRFGRFEDYFRDFLKRGAFRGVACGQFP